MEFSGGTQYVPPSPLQLVRKLCTVDIALTWVRGANLDLLARAWIYTIAPLSKGIYLAGDDRPVLSSLYLHIGTINICSMQ